MSLNLAPGHEPLTFREKACYAMGDVANGLAVSSSGFWILIYYTDVAMLAPALAGLVLLAGRWWDAVTDPVMGWLVDRTKSRWGKRRPYLLFGAIFYAITYFAIWTTPEFGSQMAVFWYAMLIVLLFNTAFTVVNIPYVSLTAALTQDYHQRTSLTAYRMAASQSAFLVGAALPSALVGWVATPAGRSALDNLGLNQIFGSWAGTPRQGYFLMATIFSAVMLLAIWITFLWGSKERVVEEEPLPAAGEDAHVHPLSYFWGLIKALKRNRPYRLAILIFLCSNVAATLIAVMLPYFLQYVMEAREYQTKVVATLFISAIIGMPFWNFVVQRYGKAETYRIAMLFFSLILGGLSIVPKHQVGYLFTLAIGAGVCYGAALLIPWAMIPDVVEYDQLQTGARREGLLYGGTTFCYKLASALAIFLSGATLGAMGYVPNAIQSGEVLMGIRILISICPIVILLVGAYIAFRYPLTRERHREVLRVLKSSSSAEERFSAQNL